MEDQKDRKIRSEETHQIDELLERSAEIKVRYQRSLEKAEELRQRAHELLEGNDSLPRKKTD
ncbi:hypothetical protein [Pedobacter miscanthi]|uniref:hypothetical protein n=1 Tax=Pedobacter miscanthi TaxID=2259170 RepID=UPI00292EAC5F|nr:hypothetical protein [Pedobacter miscanthi]